MITPEGNTVEMKILVMDPENEKGKENTNE